MRLSRALSSAACFGLLGLLAAPAGAGEGTAPLGPAGRALARAGAGLVAGDDAFSMTRNPASMARLREDSWTLGAQSAIWRLDTDDTPLGRGKLRSAALGGPAIAYVQVLGQVRARGWRDPFDVPIRAAVGWAGPVTQARTAWGEIRLARTTAPASIEVRAKGSHVSLSEILITTVGPEGGAPLDSTTATGATLSAVDWTRIAAWQTPKWPPAATGAAAGGTVVVRYRYRFTAAAGVDDFAVVRVDVNGKEAARRDHEPPAIESPNGHSGSDGPAPVEPLLDSPSQATVDRLEQGHWRLGVALSPAAQMGSAIDAPGQASNYRLQYLSEALTVGLANEIFDGFAVGVSGKIYASTILDLQLPVTVSDGLGGTQTDALDLDLAYTAGFGIAAGVTWQPCPTKCFTVGLHYSSRAWMGSHRGDAAISGLSIPLVSVNNITGSWDAAVRGLTLPQNAGLGIAWRPGTDDNDDAGGPLLVVADVAWWDWGSEMNDIKIVLDGGDANAAAATGAAPTRVRIPLNWKDRWSAAIGASVRVADPLLLHVGYSYGGNPHAGGFTHPLFPAAIRHHVGVGGSLKLGAFEMTLSGALGMPEQVKLTGGLNTDVNVSELSSSLTLQYRF